ncbi:8184_t:CDS:10 [Funneliformis mosseae]|uniref:8184_t:CDS:1 n=1 Tax=Funneliformis mosseae TaxID=27381 RepID=A0A9N9C3A1_FUNMO|nr:8184_t:CDS:10 [Funneliformis mosseae]
MSRVRTIIAIIAVSVSLVILLLNYTSAKVDVDIPQDNNTRTGYPVWYPPFPRHYGQDQYATIFASIILMRIAAYSLITGLTGIAYLAFDLGFSIFLDWPYDTVWFKMQGLCQDFTLAITFTRIYFDTHNGYGDETHQRLSDVERPREYNHIKEYTFGSVSRFTPNFVLLLVLASYTHILGNGSIVDWDLYFINEMPNLYCEDAHKTLTGELEILLKHFIKDSCEWFKAKAIRKQLKEHQEGLLKATIENKINENINKVLLARNATSVTAEAYYATNDYEIPKRSRTDHKNLPRSPERHIMPEVDEKEFRNKREHDIEFNANLTIVGGKSIELIQLLSDRMKIMKMLKTLINQYAKLNPSSDITLIKLYGLQVYLNELTIYEFQLKYTEIYTAEAILTFSLPKTWADIYLLPNTIWIWDKVPIPSHPIQTISS